MKTRRFSTTRGLIWAGSLMLAWMACGVWAAEPQRVLLLHSFGREFEPFSTFSENLRTELAKSSGQPLDYFDVALQTARFDQGAEEPFVKYLSSLFAGRELDLVVTLGGPAARFTQKYRGQLFPGRPVLLAAVDQRHVQSTLLTTNDAVVTVRHEPRLLIEDILRVLPGTTNLVVVFGNSPLEKFWVEEFRQAWQPFSNRVGFDWLNQLSFTQIKARVAALPPHTAIFYGHMAVDADGVPHVEGHALADLHRAANAPIFGIHDYQLGQGIVGGPLSSTYELSRQTAAVARRILRGEAVGGLRPPALGPGKFVYDWRELQRWNIAEERLPAGSEVQFRQVSVLNRYSWQIAAVAVACLAQAIVISMLMANQARRRRAEQSLRESRNRLRAILDTAVEGIITIDEQGRIESINAATVRMFGYAAEELIGQNVSMLMPLREEHDQHPASYQRIRPAKIIGVGREVSGRRKDGSVFPIDLAVNEIGLADRRVFTGFVRDITERKQAEQSAREFSGHLIRAQEAERARIARELHDDITQRIASLAIDVGRIERGVAGSELSGTMRAVREGLVRLSEDVHSLSYRLHPSLLEDLGLTDALRAECERFARDESIPTATKLQEVPASMPREAALCLFRVAQEALHNVARHARARAAQVSLQQLDGGLQLAVRDDGAGFDASQQRRRGSLGLASMRERVRQLDGELDIESAPGQGTAVVAWVPSADL